MKTPSLQPIVRRWQRRLRLHDWRLSVRWATETEMAEFFANDPSPHRDPKLAAKLAVAATDEPGPHAVDTTPAERREATVLLKKGAFATERDVESAVVHELLHLVLWALTPDSEDYLATVELERAVNALEEALMAEKSVA